MSHYKGESLNHTYSIQYITLQNLFNMPWKGPLLIKDIKRGVGRWVSDNEAAQLHMWLKLFFFSGYRVLPYLWMKY